MDHIDNVKRPHIVIVGAGFGGVKVAQGFADKNVDVTLVDRNNYHLFQPLLYQVSTACLSTDEIAYPIRAFFRNHKNVNFHLGEVEDFDLDHKTIITTTGKITYDYLVMAAGATTNFFGMESVEKNSFAMKTLEESVTIRNHVLSVIEEASREADPQKRKQLLTFVCVGGGPTGVEEAGSLSELMYNVMREEYHNLDLNEVDIKLIEATDKVLPMMPESLRNSTVNTLRKKRVDVRLETQVMNYDGENLTFKSGEVIPTKTVIWAAGVKAVPIVAKMGAEMDRAGRVIINEYLQLPNRPEVYAIGDMAHFLQDGRPLATIAPVATQQAVVCINNIMGDINGQPMKTFHYEDVGSMATIGRGDAVMCKGDMKFDGFIAWFAWMLIHLLRLAGFHTNVTVVLKWIWNYFSDTRLGRIITR
ncbi:MAG: putative dehydrogenase [Firmicutes bacterium]|nr:putative dehydrogenase [Bacillota bacterium]